MTTLLGAALSGATPLAFVSAEVLLVVAAGLAALGAALTIALVRRAGRKEAERTEQPRRRAPSPASLGMAEDPIVAAIEADAAEGKRKRARHADQIEL